MKNGQTLTTAQAFQASSTYHQHTVDAIANLATATAIDRETVATLATANAALTTTNATLSAELARANAELTAALKKIASMAQTIQTLKQKGKEPATYSTEHKHYCWTCGHNSPHPSHKCDNKKEGHKDRATKYNTLGGESKVYQK